MSIESSKAARRYFPHINLLRAFAAITVFVYHVIEHMSWQAFPREYGMWWFRKGWVAVDLFFVISGFVIAWSLLQWQPAKQTWRNMAKAYGWRRAGRILPLYWLTMVAFLFVHPALLEYGDAWKHGLVHLLMIHNIHPDWSGSINGVNWSIAVEVQFYLLMVLTVAWWRNLPVLRLFLIAVLIAWACRGGAFFYAELQAWTAHRRFVYASQLFSMLDIFAYGVVLALLFYRGALQKLENIKGYALWGMMTCLAGYISFSIHSAVSDYWNTPGMMILWRTSLGLFFAGVVGLALLLPALASDVAKWKQVLYRVGYYLGDISYGIYLWHLPVILLCKEYFTDPLTVFVVGGGAVLLLSAASWHWVERPAVKWVKNRSN